MTTIRPTKLRWSSAALAVSALLAVTAACSSNSSGAGDSVTGGGQPLVGLFRLTPGVAHGTQISGTWFRMLQPHGNVKTGPYMINANSTADGGRVTLLKPGTSGGLRTSGYQSQPTPAFDHRGNSLADSVVAPTRFSGSGSASPPTRLIRRTKTKVAPPTVVNNDGKLTADLAAWAASWNKQNFNQGAPKPVSGTGAKAPGQQDAERAFDYVAHKYLAGAPKPTVNGDGATGTYNAKTGPFVLQWTSPIVGGTLQRITGLWHLAGVFQPSNDGP
jgi:hypothetical protein